MRKKYFFFDIDGTLTDKQTGKIVPSAKDTIEKLKSNGHFVAIATGRAYYKTKDFAKMAGIHHIVSNGGAAITLNDEVIMNRPLDRDKAIALCKEAQSKGYGVLIAPNDSIDVIMNDEVFIHSVGYRKEPTRYFLDKSLELDDIKDFYKIYIAIDQNHESELTLLNSLGHIRFVKDYLTYQHDEKNKGIEEMIKIVDGNIEDVVVFGDDYNDLIMFDPRFTKIAMGNACDELKIKADFVTKSNVEDGIQYAAKHFGWI